MSRFRFALLLVLAPPALAQGCKGVEPRWDAVHTDLQRNRVAAAEALLKPLATAFPDCPWTVLLTARLQAAQGENPEANASFLRYLEAMPDDPAAMAYYARFLVGQAEYQRADDLSAAALDHGPSNPAALAVRGQILDMKRQTRIGLELLERSCVLDPGDVEAQFQLGALYDRAKRPADAVKHFQQVVGLDPDYASGWDYLALNTEALGDAEGADAAFKRGLAVDPPGPRFDAFLDYNYGRFLAKRNQLAESKRHLDRAVELVPQLRDTWYDRAKVELRLADLPAARSDAEKAESIPGRTGGILDLQVYALLGQIYRRLGEKVLAEKYAALTRDTPPPIRRQEDQAPLQ